MLSNFRRLLVCGALIGAALVPTAAWSAGTLDQQQTSSGTFEAVVGVSSSGTFQSQAQTFRAGLSGTLDRVDLLLSGRSTNTEGLTVEIWSEWNPVGPDLLASTHIPPGDVPSSNAFVPVVFATPGTVYSPQIYRIVVYTDANEPSTTDSYIWSGATGDPYPEGMSWSNAQAPPPRGWNPHSTDVDFAFKTYVTPEKETCGGLTPTKVGTPGNDTLTGTGGVDVIAGLGGNDTINAGSGDDVICGGDGHDTINSGSGNDKLSGEAGNDTLTGGSNDDTLDGGDGADTLSGGSGNDGLTGGAGSPDTCEGGSGNDTGGSGCESTKSIP